MEPTPVGYRGGTLHLTWGRPHDGDYNFYHTLCGLMMGKDGRTWQAHSDATASCKTCLRSKDAADHQHAILARLGIR